MEAIYDVQANQLMPGHQQFIDSEIVQRMQGQNFDSDSKAGLIQQSTISHGDVLDCMETLLDYFEQDEEAFTGKFVLTQRQANLSKRVNRAKKHRKIIDYFNKT